MQSPTPHQPTPPQTLPPSAVIQTTLYDLIAAISAEVGPDEEEVVLATVVHLLNSGRARFVGDRRMIEVDCSTPCR